MEDQIPSNENGVVAAKKHLFVETSGIGSQVNVTDETEQIQNPLRLRRDLQAHRVTNDGTFFRSVRMNTDRSYEVVKLD